MIWGNIYLYEYFFTTLLNVAIDKSDFFPIMNLRYLPW